MSAPWFVERIVKILDGLPLLPDNAPYVHAAVLEAMNGAGLLVLPEYWIKYDDEHTGRIDLVVLDKNQKCAIELDCRRPRSKSLAKLRAFQGGRVLALRGVAGRVEIHDIDAVVPIRVRLESTSEEADKRAVSRAYDKIRGRQ